MVKLPTFQPLPDNLNLQGSRPVSHDLGAVYVCLVCRADPVWKVLYRWKLLSGNLYTFIKYPSIQDPSTIIESSEKPTKSRYLLTL
jgi:hypothetical protein